jgi:magnesium transporter
MTTEMSLALDILNRRFLIDFPREAARRIETLPADEALAVLSREPVALALPVWETLVPGVSDRLMAQLADDTARELLSRMDAGRAAALLSRLEPERREHLLSLLDPALAKELGAFMLYPADSAGHLMDTRINAFRNETRIEEAVARLRAVKPRATRQLKIVDDANRLIGVVPIENVVVADPDETLETLARPPAAVVSAIDPREHVVDTLNRLKLEELAVIDVEGRLLGVIRYSGLIDALQEEASVDIQTMVGASKDERALSTSWFAVRKRLPWLQINLLTAFLAASVVGLFEDTIARFTALAVLLPVVAGQSGNAGAQALAVTMRGLALREIGLRHWLRVTTKETMVGLLNGIGIAATTAIGVYVWSGNYGLSLVIAVSMVLSMVAAGIAGALVPIGLKRVGQDPATSSSIILTTVTDIAGFFSFLGIATALAGMLE